MLACHPLGTYTMPHKDFEGHKGLEIRKTTVRYRISVPKDVAILLANISDELQLSIPTLTKQLLMERLGLSHGTNKNRNPD